MQAASPHTAARTRQSRCRCPRGSSRRGAAEAADEQQDDGDEHERLDGAVRERRDNVVAIAAHRRKGSREQTEQREDERPEPETAEDEPANVETLVGGGGEAGEAEGAADEPDEGEDGEVAPAGRLGETVAEAEHDGAAEKGCVEEDLGDG
ncbi:hypothetical protein CRV24_001011 [Beauveria bassiana]|nr:hypothetical protein CRV24_001011 [Beauveria bassiana]KAH8720420.1 hypothetical protein HC256_000814 [Beauveria bassiana]